MNFALRDEILSIERCIPLLNICCSHLHNFYICRVVGCDNKPAPPIPSTGLFPCEVAKKFHVILILCLSSRDFIAATIKRFLNCEDGPSDQIDTVLVVASASFATILVSDSVVNHRKCYAQL